MAIMPDRQQFAVSLKHDSKMHYPVLTDMDNGYALSLNLAIWVGAEVQELMAASGRDLPRYQGNDPGCCRCRRASSWMRRASCGRASSIRITASEWRSRICFRQCGTREFHGPFHPGSFVARARSRLPIPVLKCY